MTQVDFYILATDSDDARLTFACRLAEKAMLKDRHVFMHAASAADGTRLDRLLWTFSQGSFVPHRVVSEGDDGLGLEPVLIGAGQAPSGGRWDVLINLADDVPEFFSRYQRVAELVDEAAARREAGRARYRYYRDRGFALNTHRI